MDKTPPPEELIGMPLLLYCHRRDATTCFSSSLW